MPLTDPLVTPKKTGQEINELICKLNLRWGLRIRVWIDKESPSQVVAPGSTREKIFRKIRFLYYRGRGELDKACQRFEDHAAQQLSMWVPKPFADTDTLPLRPSGDSQLRRDLSSQTSRLSNEQVEALETTLLRFLDEATGTKPISQTNSNSTYHTTQIEYVTVRQTLMNQRDSSPTPSGPTSSYLFNAESETTNVMQDIVMTDIQVTYPSLQSQPVLPQLDADLESGSSDGEQVFSTPPPTPPRKTSSRSRTGTPPLEEESRDNEDDQYLHKSDTAKLPTPDSVSKKRQRSEVFTGPGRVLQYPAYNRDASVASTQRSYSTVSSTQQSCSTIMEPPTAITTPNTSFYDNSVNTSFTDISFNAQPMRANRDANTRKTIVNDGEGNIIYSDPLKDKLVSMSPFSETDYHLASRGQANGTGSIEAVSTSVHGDFRQLYETSRFVTHSKVPLSSLPVSVKQTIDDYGQLWSSLLKCMPDGKVGPERSSKIAWDKAKTNPAEIIFSGDLAFSDTSNKEGPVFELKLKPLKLAKSNRVGRRFGGDRLFVLGIPELTNKSILKNLKCGEMDFQKSFVDWLLDTEHHFLGRRWRAFWLKAVTGKVKSKTFKHQVYLFAIDGSDFSHRPGLRSSTTTVRQHHAPVSIQELLEWYIPFGKNREKPCLKLFARLTQAVSATIATIKFEPGEIIRTSDAWSDSPGVRRLSIDCISPDIGTFRHSKEARVMNDGCARISYAAAKEIAIKLGLAYPPSIIQGRIAGAKGVWMLDPLGESINSANPDRWIEITDSQWKFECDLETLDQSMLTFDVNSCPTPLKPAKLNYELMPILINGGVPSQVFEKLIREDLRTRVQDLEEAMSNPLLLRKWIQEKYSVASQRRSHGSVEMIGGLPASLAEMITWFVEHGFEPRHCERVKVECFTAMSQYCNELEDRMKVEIGRSASPFIIADPLAVLEEGEIHMGFSSAFIDEKSGFNETFLSNIDVLVARNPAHLPSDIQKVRAVFRPELSMYKDVLVFSSKGPRSLADKLSGGDYDGDTAWLCWDPDLVTPFVNTEPPESPPEPDTFGMTKDITKVSDILQKSNFISRFLHLGFSFNIQTDMLGTCTSYHESLIYLSEHPIDSPPAKEIGSLLGYLVDSAKAGLSFNEEKWRKYKEARKLPYSLPKPAYKDKQNANPTDHIIDRLVFVVAKGLCTRVLTNLHEKFKDVARWDTQLATEAKAEIERSKQDTALKLVIDQLKKELEELHNYWVIKNAHEDEKLKPVSSLRPGKTPFRPLAENCRDRFLNIQPCKSVNSDIVARWRSKDGFYNQAWTLLKASMLYKYHYQGKFPWYICGVELGELKLRANGQAHTMSEDMWLHYRLDTKAVKRLHEETDGMARVVGPCGSDDEDEEECGTWEDNGWHGVMDDY